jgi:TatD DNase family protein
MDEAIFSTHPMINFHTHEAKHLDRADIVEIVSMTSPTDRHFFSLERHPWHISSPITEIQANELRSQLQHKNCLALGEIGLDKNKGVAFEEQVQILRSILTIAEQEQKPVILHCVKAFDEIIQLKKEFKAVPNWAIHGFNKNPELAKQLSDHGFYLSINVGKVNDPKALLELIPHDRLFLETDNSPILIEDNYLRAAEMVGIELDQFKMQIAQNAKYFFEHE